MDSSTTTTTCCSSLRGRELTLRLGGRGGGVGHLTPRVPRNILRNATVCGLPGAQLPTTREGRAAELGGRLFLVGRFVLVGSQLLVLGLRLPVAEVIFGVVQDLAGLGAVSVGLALVPWYHGAVVQELEEPASVAG